MLLEPAAARQAAENNSTAGLADMRRAIEDEKAAHAKGVVHAMHANSYLSRLWFRIRQLDDFELVYTSKTFYTNCFHVSCFSCAMRLAMYSASRAMPRK